MLELFQCNEESQHSSYADGATTAVHQTCSTTGFLGRLTAYRDRIKMGYPPSDLARKPSGHQGAADDPEPAETAIGSSFDVPL
jgi:hypothetical protein